MDAESLPCPERMSGNHRLKERSYPTISGASVTWKVCLFCQVTERHIQDRQRVVLAANLENRERDTTLPAYREREPMAIRDVLDELFSAQILREKASA